MEPNASNDVTPIERIPAEVLALIFSIVVNSNILLRGGVRPREPALSHANVIAGICSRWRSIALGTPSLWSYIDFAGVRCLEHVTLLLDRSQGFPLDVIITSDFSLTLKSILPLVLPHLNRLNSIYYYNPHVKLAEQWLSEWLKHGIPATLTTLALYPWFGMSSLVFPPKLNGHPQERLDELLSSVNTVFLHSVEVDLERTAFRNLTTLNLRTLPNHTSLDRLVQILLASPALESLQLYAVFIDSGSTIDRQAVPLTRLHTLELVLDPEVMLLLLALLRPGSRDLTFKIDLSELGYGDPSDKFKAELCAFFERSTVKTLYFSGRNVLACIAATSNLETLVLNNMFIDQGICCTIAPPTNCNVELSSEPVRLPWPKLHTIHAINCNISDVDGFKRVLSTCPIRELRVESDRGMNTQGSLERLEDWGVPGLDFGTTCRDWTIGYAPFHYRS